MCTFSTTASTGGFKTKQKHKSSHQPLIDGSKTIII